MTVWFYHATYAFQSESTFCCCLMSRNSLLKRGVISSFAKWLSVRLGHKWLWIQILLQPLKTSDIAPVLSKEFLDIPVITDCKITIKRVYVMVRTRSQMCYTDKYSQNSSIIKINNCIIKSIKG